MRFAIRTYGCRANQYDSETIRELLKSAGGVEVASVENADVAIFNSCTVTSASEAELRKDIRRAAALRSGLRTIVTGCAAALPGRDEVTRPLRSLPSVSDVIPGADLDAIATALDLNPPRTRQLTSVQTGARALLRIQDGCNEHCTFCATTLARGEARSRPVEEIAAEATILADRHPEIVITGIHIGSYGVDIGSSLGELMQTLVRCVPRVRFRLSSIEATEVDDRLMDLFQEPARVAPHLHAPLQSGSDAVLRRMGRHWYTVESYRQRVEALVAGHASFGLSADVISGFPGESLDDHLRTVGLVTELPFTSLHVFPFSPRPGTAATRLGDSLPQKLVSARAAELRVIAREKAVAYAARRDGGRADVVVIERGRGLTGDYLSVDVPSDRPRRDRFDAMLVSRENHLSAVAL